MRQHLRQQHQLLFSNNSAIKRLNIYANNIVDNYSIKSAFVCDNNIGNMLSHPMASLITQLLVMLLEKIVPRITLSNAPTFAPSTASMFTKKLCHQMRQLFLQQHSRCVSNSYAINYANSASTTAPTLFLAPMLAHLIE